MAWLPRVCGGLDARYRLHCSACYSEFGTQPSIELRRGDTHTDEPCDRCGRTLAETVPAGTVEA